MKIKSFKGGYDKNFCYLLWDTDDKNTFIIDPSVETNQIINFINQHDLIVHGILITHTHHDHIRYLDEIISIYPYAKIYASKLATSNLYMPFIGLSDNQNIYLNKIKALFTPGHYKDSMCYWVKSEKIIFTGDTIFVGRTGRTISSDSSIDDLYNSVYNTILKLPKDTIIYPGHDYGISKTISIKDNIKLSNFFQCRNIDEFTYVMNNFENSRKK